MDKLFTYQRREVGFIELNLIPLVDVILNLLIFFLLVGSAMSAGIEVQLPKASSSTSIEQSNSIVVILNNQTVKYQDRLMSIEQFSREFKSSPSSKLVVQANSQVSVQTLISVFDVAKAHSVEVITVQTLPNSKLNEP